MLTCLLVIIPLLHCLADHRPCPAIVTARTGDEVRRESIVPCPCEVPAYEEFLFRDGLKGLHDLFVRSLETLLDLRQAFIAMLDVDGMVELR